MLRSGAGRPAPGFEPVWSSAQDTALDLDDPNDADFLAGGNVLIADSSNGRVIEVETARGARSGSTG